MPPRTETPSLPFDGRVAAPSRDPFPSRAPWADRPRLSKQCQAILDRLRQGPTSNRVLATLALKYTGRLSELRRAGYPIGIRSQDHATGLVVYELRGDPDAGVARFPR